MRGLVASALFGLIAGTCDASAFLALHRLLTANITGDIVLLGADWASGNRQQELGRILALPVFLVWMWLTRLAVGVLQRHGWPSLRPLLWADLALVAAFTGLALTSGPFRSQDAPNTLIVGMIGVMAMASLNIIARLWSDLTAGTTAMTGNAVRVVIDVVEMALGHRPDEPELARQSLRLAATIVCFAAGCALAALVYVAAGIWCAALPLAFTAMMTALCPTEDPKQPGNP